MSKRGLPETVRMRHEAHYVETLPASAGRPIGRMVPLGLLTVNALVAATHLLIPIQSSYFALEGTDDLLETVQRVQSRANPGLDILGVLITMHDRRTTLGRDINNRIREAFGPKVFRTVIAKNVRLEEGPAYRESIFAFAPNSTGATDYYSLCEEVMDRV